ncbi:MAG: Fic family protein [Nanoarchaeota archaeon]
MGKKTLAKIDNIVGRINTHPEYSACVSRHFLAQMRQEAYSHSSSIELESDEVKGRRDIDNLKRTYVGNLEAGRNYLAQESISLTTIDGLVRVVEPSAKSKGIRKEAIKFGSFYGVDPEKLYSEVDNLVFKINNGSSIHPVDRASLTHLEMIRIHPYSDGNGRSARLLQNFCLEQRGYPPAIIDAGEREVYIGILNSVWSELMNNGETSAWSELMNNRETGNSSNRSIILFNNYIESKVLESAERLEEELQQNRIYEVTFSKVRNFGAIKSIVANLKSAESKRGKAVQANHINRNGKSVNLKVCGDLSARELKNVIETFGKKFGVSFSVKSIPECWDN